MLLETLHVIEPVRTDKAEDPDSKPQKKGGAFRAAEFWYAG